MKFRPKRSARENAAQVLPRLANAFYRAGDAAYQDELHGEELHDFRIRAKRFRYVLEYFRPCYGHAMDGYIEFVRNLQAALGDLNDCCATRTLLPDLLPPGHAASFKRLFSALDRREQELFEAYRTFWVSQMQGPQDRSRFVRYLSHPPRRRPRTARARSRRAPRPK